MGAYRVNTQLNLDSGLLVLLVTPIPVHRPSTEEGGAGKWAY